MPIHLRLVPLILPIVLLLAACQGNTSAGAGSLAETAVEPAETAPPEPDPTLPPPATAVPSPNPTDALIPMETPIPTHTPVPPTATPPPAPVTQVRLEKVIDGFFAPLGLEHVGDDRLFVVQQPGWISVVEDGNVLEKPFLDIVDRVNSRGNEQGLLGLAFHPEFAANGRFFVNYNRADGSTVISEFAASRRDPNTADATQERQLLVIPQPYPNHNGGQIRFGPDGYLYIGMGDGGSQGDPLNAGQDLGNLLGSLLRIDVDGGDPYGIPPSNPWVETAGARPEVWAKGLRNPWRFSFDRLTGDLYIADVGQNQWEEINFEPTGSGGGLNYGWRLFEGTHCFADGCPPEDLIMPIAEYNHQGRHCSVTGGHVYRGRNYPEMWGNYFYADYCSGSIWRLFRLPDGTWEEGIVGQADFLVSSFGEDWRGELYLVDQNGGAIHRLIPVSGS